MSDVRNSTLYPQVYTEPSLNVPAWPTTLVVWPKTNLVEIVKVENGYTAIHQNKTFVFQNAEQIAEWIKESLK